MLTMCAFIITGCKKQSTYMNTIKITNADMTVPPCAPTYHAVWQGVTMPDSLVTISNTGPTIGLTDSTSFPVVMDINWVAHTPSCSGQITITSYHIH